MQRFSSMLVAAVAVMTAPAALAQTRVHTEIVRPAAPPAANGGNRADDVANTGAIAAPNAVRRGTPEVITDMSKLPPAVALMRERILTAARTGKLDVLVSAMQSSKTLPIFSQTGDKDPIAYWRRNYPDSEGLEVLAILTEILDTPCVRVDAGTPEETYVWPYFARMQLKTLTAEQKVELFKIITGGDYKDMLNAGTYNFFRLGIGQDGGWRFFVSGD
jgi:hypothetical protein